MNAPDQATGPGQTAQATVPRAIEVAFPVVEINRLAEPERNSFKPIYQTHKWFPFVRGSRLRVTGFEATILEAGDRSELAGEIHRLLASRANELERMGGFVQIVFEWPLFLGDELWFERGRERIGLRSVFGNVRREQDGSNVYYLTGFNLT